MACFWVFGFWVFGKNPKTFWVDLPALAYHILVCSQIKNAPAKSESRVHWACQFPKIRHKICTVSLRSLGIPTVGNFRNQVKFFIVWGRFHVGGCNFSGDGTAHQHLALRKSCGGGISSTCVTMSRRVACRWRSI